MLLTMWVQGRCTIYQHMPFILYLVIQIVQVKAPVFVWGGGAAALTADTSYMLFTIILKCVYITILLLY